MQWKCDKNAHGVIIPGTKGLKGVELSATLGVILGNSDRKLEVLSTINDEIITEALGLINEGFCEVQLATVSESLYIQICLFNRSHNASVTIVNDHINIKEIKRDEIIIYSKPFTEQKRSFEAINFESIYAYATNSLNKEIIPLLDQQIDLNLKIAEEGLKGNWGANVGKLNLMVNGNSVPSLSASYAAAASDARMSECGLPVVINSGSGNQGLTVSLPIIIYARHLNVTRTKLYQALILGNLLAIYMGIKKGKLSAYCGAVSAAASSAAAIAFLHDDPKKVVEETYSNALVSISGIFCDGAKSSCAMKILASLNTALLSYEQAKHRLSYKPGEGLRKETTDETVNFIGEIAESGMRDVDILIINNLIMN